MATDTGEKPIGDLASGDTVLAYNQATGQNEYDAIEQVHITDDPETESLTLDDETITTTPHHPFYTQDRGWVDAGALTIGEQVRKDDGTVGTVHAILLHEQTRRMYNLTVARAHTFFVGLRRWLVHNTSCPDQHEPVFNHQSDTDLRGYNYGSREHAFEHAKADAGIPLSDNWDKQITFGERISSDPADYGAGRFFRYTGNDNRSGTISEYSVIDEGGNAANRYVVEHTDDTWDASHGFGGHFHSGPVPIRESDQESYDIAKDGNKYQRMPGTPKHYYYSGVG